MEAANFLVLLFSLHWAFFFFFTLGPNIYQSKVYPQKNEDEERRRDESL